MSAPSIVGEIHGYADEVTYFIRHCRKFEKAVRDRTPETKIRFYPGPTVELGTRGIFNKRRLISIEYKFVLDNNDQGPHIMKLLAFLARRMS